MDLNQFDWNQARAFLATAEEGSLSAAARRLGQTQPTLGRQVAALEADLGVTLFERVGRGLELTQSGRELLSHVQTMDQAAHRLTLAARGKAEEIEGEVRITASDLLSYYVVPDAISKIRLVAPKLKIEIVAANEIQDLLRREADIAIRHIRPEQPDLVARLVREGGAGFYATPSYIERFGTPLSPADCPSHQFIGYGDDATLIGHLQNYNIHLQPENILLGSANGIVAWGLVQRGFAIGVMSHDIARMTPGLVRVLNNVREIKIPMWLTTHREIHTSRKIRLVFDILAETLAKYPASD